MDQKIFRIAVVSDLHFASEKLPNAPLRHGEYSDTFLLRAVHRFNRFIRPDVVLVAGDLINNALDPDVPELLEKLKKTLDLLTVPYRVIPGNHDPVPDVFYKVFPEHRQMLDVGRFRFVPFADPETPVNNACRQPEDFERMRLARENWDGELIALQHVPVGPPGDHPCWYNFDNANDVLAAMKKYRFTACISGHEHAGLPVRELDGTTLICTPGLCESPFSYLVIDIDAANTVHVSRENLALEAALKLEDHHVHTTFAYCNENLALSKTRELARLFHLARIVYTEHSSHLLFSREDLRQYKHFLQGLSGADPADSRLEQYLQAQQTIQPDLELTGMELDYDRYGQPVLPPPVKDRLAFRNGAVHNLSSSIQTAPLEVLKKDFMQMNEAVLQSGVEAVAHPFRIFSFNTRNPHPVPEDLFLPLVKLLKKYGTAAEMNFHYNKPDEEFFALCVANGVKISLGTDTHNLYEVGEFYPHMKLLDKIAPGWRSNPQEILLQA